jgi:Cu-Zn family superoxide dismutase
MNTSTIKQNAITLVKGVATFIPNKHSDISGVIYFEQPVKGGYTNIYGHINGLSVGKHGIHIHQYGDLTAGCESAGPHYNPFGHKHGGPDMSIRHVGDLGNIECTNPFTSTFFVLKDNLISLVGPYSVIGRTLVIHEDEDDLGLSNHPLSSTTGNSGRRIACAIIGIASSN